MIASWLNSYQVLGFGQSAATSLQAFNGTGRRFESLPPAELEIYEKVRHHEPFTLSYSRECQAGYGAAILFILCLFMSKMSLLVLFYQTSPVAQHRRIVKILGVIFCLWTIANVLVALFQCSVPQVWAYLGPHCINLVRPHMNP